MVACIRRMVVGHKKWLDDASFRGGIALCRMVPGATAMQSAAFVALVLKVEIYRVVIAGIIVSIILI